MLRILSRPSLVRPTWGQLRAGTASRLGRVECLAIPQADAAIHGVEAHGRGALEMTEEAEPLCDIRLHR
jgi:hypothetical protein